MSGPWASPHRGVAVVMPTRNQARFLEAALRSVLDQGVEGLRIYVQDGASDDDTQAVLERIARRHPGLVWASAPDAGPADAINRALSKALADPDVQVLGWLNSDDLYRPGALARALQHLAARPEHVAVYGQGEHIDLEGRPLGRYPTGRPDLPRQAWADGCPVCQPTMFLRREAIEAIGALDTALRTAFDYDLWFRLFARFEGRIGFVDEVLASSRLHDQGLTLSQRRTVALEGLQVVHRHLGAAPAHWLLTYADELRRQLPDGAQPTLSVRLVHTLHEARGWLAPSEADAVLRRWRQDRAVQLATRDCVADVHPDGWMPPQASLRLRSDKPATLLLRGRHEGAQIGPLQLEAVGPDGVVQRTGVARRGPFTWRIEVPALAGQTQHWHLRCTPGFVPARTSAASSDARELGWLLDCATLVP